jgi:hypothetical protein
VNSLRLLIASADRRLLRSVVALFDPDCAVRTATSGIECVRQLRDGPPDLLVLVPPVLWGGEAGVVAVMGDDPALHAVPILVFPDPAADGPSIAQFVPRATGHSARVAHVVGRLCRCFRHHYCLTEAAPAPAAPAGHDFA